MSNYPVAQPSAGVPAPRGLLFEPTEILANRVMDAEGETVALRRKLTWRTLVSVILFFMLLTAAAAVAFVWWSSQQQVAAAQLQVEAAQSATADKQEQLDELTEQRDTIREFANSLEVYQGVQNASDELDVEQQDFLQLTKWYLENKVPIPEEILDDWYPLVAAGQEDPVLEQIEQAIRLKTELPPPDTLRIGMPSDGWRDRAFGSIIGDRDKLKKASEDLRAHTARVVEPFVNPPPPRPVRRATPYQR